jgi:hypothetical protein
MNRHLDDAIAQVRSLSDEGQREAAALLFEFLDQQKSDIRLTPEQVAEIERRLGDDEPFASDQEVRDLYARLTK